MEQIVVLPQLGVKAGVGAAVDRDDVKYRNVVGQGFIEDEAKVLGKGSGGVEMQHVLTGVDLSIRAAAANDTDFLVQHLAQAAFYSCLHCAYSSRLLLPASVAKTFICEVEEVAFHSGQRYKSFLPLQKNMERHLPITIALLLLPLFSFGQTLEEQLQQVEHQLQALEQQAADLKAERETIKLERIQRDLKQIGLPTEDYILHSAMALSYAEPYEQARWVAHIILPDIIEGTVGRTNDFREDPKVATGTAVEQDYFLKYLQPDSSYEYDGFGYDRGHLAPSADFRWSKKALSESYYYSNMSPQLADFNREAWAELEALLRSYLYEHPNTQLYVVTGPILQEGLPVIERSVNKVAIPKQYFKIALDLESGRGIGFIMPNRKIEAPLETFAVSIDEVETRTGLDFFALLEDSQENHLEAALDKTAWIPELAAGDVEPLYPPDLPRNHFNTVQAKRYMGSGEEVTVCGTVVSTRYSRSGNLWLNIDKRFPNHIFSVFVRKKDLPNFSYDPKSVLENKKVCISGEVENFSGTPTMNVAREERIQLGIPEK